MHFLHPIATIVWNILTKTYTAKPTTENKSRKSPNLLLLCSPFNLSYFLLIFFFFFVKPLTSSAPDRLLWSAAMVLSCATTAWSASCTATYVMEKRTARMGQMKRDVLFSVKQVPYIFFSLLSWKNTDLGFNVGRNVWLSWRKMVFLFPRWVPVFSWEKMPPTRASVWRAKWLSGPIWWNWLLSYDWELPSALW